MSTMRAFITNGDGSGSVQSIPRPTPGHGEILVKIHYAALNPGDWKLVEGNVAASPAPQGLIAGCDFAGTVEDANGSHWDLGHRVGGWVHGTTYQGVGAFAEFMTIEATLVFAIPDNISFQQASTISLAFATATQAMYRQMTLPNPYDDNGIRENILIYGASTSVGQYAVQLGKLSGLRVIAISSAKNHNLLKRLGADATLDYHDDDWVDRVKELTQDKLRYALDVIAEADSSETVACALIRRNGAHLVALAPVDKEALRAINSYIKAESIIAFTVFGKPLAYTVFDNAGDATPEDKRAWEEYLLWLPKMLEQGDLKPNHVKEVGTLDDVLEGFRLSKEGRLSAEKAVFRVA
ncbi:hypothetical protein FSARC_7359 [Fusarium sarcochroum]|uniref:Enoyl reductase (ER) domain-containing protein n=1 Tax=Fusarium sarcochroum TaxID=1208366 RepID=A0A8H4X842_9HYPO|nr:hypothetical protein FSARC_7359 [Fusarium sarcochroum]